MRWTVALPAGLLLTVLLSACTQPPAAVSDPAPIVLTIRTSRDSATCCAVREIPAGAPALAGYADVQVSWKDMNEFVAKEDRPQVDFDAGCKPGPSPLDEDCKGFHPRSQYRVWRLSDSLQPLDDYPLDTAGEVRLVLPEPMTLFIDLRGRIADGYPQVATHESCENSWYSAERILRVYGDAEDVTTSSSAPWLRVQGSATIDLAWGMGAGCGAPA